MPDPYTLVIDGKLYGFCQTPQQAKGRVQKLFPTTQHNVKIYFEQGIASTLYEEYTHNRDA